MHSQPIRTVWLAALLLTALAGCQALSSLPIATRSAGLPQQYEADLEQTE
ncbi:MAG: hypothetical protein KDA80_11970 [Planctomycetaceae bacterium]|nr:hypothetical protein [Planctomycetaceae bacterium]